MNIPAMLDLVQHLLQINHRKIHKTELSSTDSGVNFVRNFRNKFAWFTSTRDLQIFTISKEKPEPLIFGDNSDLVDFLPAITFFVHKQETYAVMDYNKDKPAIRISSSLFLGYTPPKTFTECSQEHLSKHDYRASDLARVQEMNLEQLHLFIPKVLGPTVAQENIIMFQQALVQV
jgi:hypothetical protein